MQTGFTYTADPSLVTSYEPLPEADYNVRITECKYEPTKDGVGTNFNFKYIVIDGQYKDRTIYDQVAWSWDTAHEKAVNIGKRKFNNILIAIGHKHFDGDTDEFIGGEMTVKASIHTYTDKKTGAEKKSNQIDAYNALSSEETSAPKTQPAPQTNSFGSVPNPFGRR